MFDLVNQSRRPTLALSATVETGCQTLSEFVAIDCKQVNIHLSNVVINLYRATS